jgi:ABC-type polysaccharide/polyol phosphate transport system ATPase subunit
MARAIIEIDSVSKSFDIPSVARETVREHLFGVLEPRRFERLTVLDRISFDVRAGETLGIMGRNGCGKSTLLKILCGIYTPDSGQVRVNAGITPILELGVGWNPELDAIDNIFLIGAVMGLSLKAVEASLGEILAFAEVERFAHLKLKHYSSGMASRLAYAIAFHAVRDVLVLDEIFAVGDAGFRVKCEARYRDLRDKGHTVVLVSHEPRTVERFCDRALVIDAGRIVASGSGDAIGARYVRFLTEGFPPERTEERQDMTPAGTSRN